MKAIEVEKKVRLEPHHVKQIEQKGSLLQQTRILDQYFDTVDYKYTTQNMWLRKRGNLFELKVGIKGTNDSVDRYEEITDEPRIVKFLGADENTNLSTALAQYGMHPFCTFYTHRTSYQLDNLKIDIDVADFGDLTYRVAEIEMVVSDLKDVEAAEQRIFQFTNEIGIDTSIPVPAKLTYYLYCKKPDHYQALVLNKVIKPVILDYLQPV